MRYNVDIGNITHVVEINEGQDGLEVMIDDKPVSISTVSDRQHQKILLLLDNRSYDTNVFCDNGRTSVFLLGRRFDCLVEDERLAAIHKVAGVKRESGGNELKAPMPGLVVRVCKSVGDKVRKGEAVVVVEAMKMENELKAAADSVVKEIAVEAGRAVNKGDLLVRFE